jgi:hypothetical protein
MTDLQYTITADDNPVKQALDRVRGHFAALQSSVTNVSAGIQGALSKVNVAMAGIAAALAGGAVLKASVEATKQFTSEANQLARVLGTNATEASTLNVALGDIYGSADLFTSAASKLAKELRTNEDSLRTMGLRTRDASGNLRPLKDLMMDSIQVVNSYKAGVDRNIAAQTAWGKGAEEFAPLLKLNNQVLEEATRKQEALGLIVGQENVQALKAYKAAMNDAGDVMLAIRKAIGDAVMPVLTRLGEWFSDIGPTAVTVIKGAIGVLVGVFWTFKGAVTAVWNVVAGFIETLTVGLAGVGTGLLKMLTGDLTGGIAAFQGAADAIKATWDSRLAAMKANTQDVHDKIAALFSAPTKASAPGNGGSRSATGLLKEAPEKSAMAGWEAELNAMKQAHAEANAAQGTFYEFGKQRERDFWLQKQQIAAAGSKDSFAVQAKITASTLELQKDAFEQRVAQMKREEAEAEQNFAVKSDLARKELALITQRYGAESKQAEDAQRHIVEIERQAREQRMELRRIEISETEAAAQQEVALQRQKQQFLLDAGLIDRAAMLQQEQQFEAQRFQIQQQGLQQRLQLLDPDKNPVEAARIKEEMLQLEREYQLRLNEIRQQSALESNRYQLQAVQGMEQGLARVFSQIGTQIKTVGQLLRAVFQMAAQVILGVLAQLLARWIAQHVLMQAMAKVGAISEISAQAGIAGAAGTASWAGAPWPINMGAPAFGAAMSAAAMAFAPMASAAQGFDIPTGVNPVTQLHAREMVLPEQQADVIRSLAGSGGAGGDTYHFHIQALDGQDVRRVLMDNPRAVADAVSTAKRRGHMG